MPLARMIPRDPLRQGVVETLLHGTAGSARRYGDWAILVAVMKSELPVGDVPIKQVMAFEVVAGHCDRRQVPFLQRCRLQSTKSNRR